MESKRLFSVNLVFLIGLNLLIKPFYLFGIEVGVQNTVGAEEYGLYYAMFNFTILFNVLLDLGINNFQKIKVAQDADSGMQNMATLLPMKLGLSGIYVIVTAGVAWMIGFEDRYWFFIGWLMLNHVLSVFLLLLRANLSGLHLFLRDSVLSVIDRLVLILAVGYLLLFDSDRFRIETFVLLQTASYALAIGLALLMTPGGKRLIAPRFHLRDMVQMARQTWPYALLILLMTAYNRIDGIMLERLATNGVLEAGIYAQAYRILDAGNSFAFLYAGLLLPIFARLVGNVGKKDEINSLAGQAARFLVIPAGVVFILAFFYGDWIMDTLYREHAVESARSLKWLMGSFVFLAAGYVYGTLITASARMKWLNRIAFATVLLNVVLNLFMIPSMGSEGAAMASFISLAFMAAAQIGYARWRFQLAFTTWIWKALLLWLIVLAGSIGCIWLGLTALQGILAVTLLSALVFFGYVVDLRKLGGMFRKDGESDE